MKKTQQEVRKESKKLIWLDKEVHYALKVNSAIAGMTMVEFLTNAVEMYKSHILENK